MRSRNIKPGFFKNEQLAEVEPYGRLLFIALWCMADREGRLDDRPKRIKVESLPYDDLSDQKINALLAKLQEYNFIQRYSIKGKKYIQITKFNKHQNPHLKETPSTIPAPEIPVQAQELPEQAPDSGTSTMQAPEIPVQAPEIPERARLIPDSLIPDSPFSESLSPAAPGEPGKGTDGFSKFWEAYPRKVGKLDAQRAWKKKGTPRVEYILEAISRQRTSPQWTRDGGRFIPNPATWLNQGRWDDAQEAAEPGTVPKCYREAEPATKRDEKLWLGPVPEDFKKVFEKIGKVD